MSEFDEIINCLANEIQDDEEVNAICTKTLNLDSAVQDDKVMQDFESESLLMRGDHSQKVKAPRIKGGSGSKDCVDLSSSTAESRLKDYQCIDHMETGSIR